ncbi:hypothetical protein EAG_10874 [Camponotus floridanus]|uniref:SUEL-type lectin domain-containing protein n=1 Tax=Camponotus floridanus TaxID=104421 RepID=E2AGC8_CAMFO|nr:hypothetical protein EAG_10874 [Camponotus floridanus]
MQCPQPRGVQEETCMMDFATETVMQLCHGKRRCSVVANSTTFGRPDPCSPNSKTYLKVVYTCELTFYLDFIVGAFGKNKALQIHHGMQGLQIAAKPSFQQVAESWRDVYQLQGPDVYYCV